MSGRALLDSNVVIDIAKGLLDVAAIGGYDRYSVSVVTYMETLGFRFESDGEKRKVEDILSCFDIIYLDKEIVDKVVLLRQTHKIKLPDAIIAATAIVQNSALLTRNTKDFQNIAPHIVNPHANT